MSRPPGYPGGTPRWAGGGKAKIMETNKSGVEAMHEAVTMAEIEDMSRELMARGLDVDELFDRRLLITDARVVSELLRLASGGGVCLNCTCDDCQAKLHDDHVANGLGRGGVEAMREATGDDR